MLKQAAGKDEAERTRATASFLEFFRTETIEHFREEEEQLFPVIALEPDAPTEGIVRVLSEHVRLHALVRKLQAAPDDAELMLEIATQLRAHVRFEEDELFPAIERVASGALDAVHLPRRE